ncbi:MAG: penicillin acylase family protein [Proteobacteria bacterium TMED72]|nr:MAG: penicillin acylase family protein [Proteobacteria bacterium TMED72]RPG20835.1 MAG: penicillin acylase family protein [Phycisphaera sp. TMED9]
MPGWFDAEACPHATVPHDIAASILESVLPKSFFHPALLITSIAMGLHLIPSESRAGVENDVRIPDLNAPVRIELDALAMPSIAATSQDDAMAGLGFMHGRDRMMQMDLSRRKAAGELAALIGPPMVAIDRPNAIRRRREIAERIVSELRPEEQRLLDAYTAGVNAAIAGFEQVPVEYRLLNTRPAEWRPADSILVVLALFDSLQNNAKREPRVGALRAMVEDDVAEWLLAVPGRWDALLIEPDGSEFIPEPPAQGFTFDSMRRDRRLAPPVPEDEVRLGSNSFAVAGSRTDDGRAILANDPHLQYSAPGIWYPAALSWPDVDMAGVSVPGIPGIPIGATDSIAWGMTNTTGDFEDMVLIDVDPANPDRYRVPEGWEDFDDRTVDIEVRGAKAVSVRSRWSRWGPVLTDTDWTDSPVSLLRVSDQPGAVNLSLMDLPEAKDVESALDVAARWFGPSQNVLIADHTGRIGWTLSGWIPNRRGYDGRSPVVHDADHGWFGTLPEDQRPIVIDPPSGFLFTANNRLIPLEEAAPIGKVWADGGRAWRIRRDLESMALVSELDLLAIQLDDTVQRFLPYRDLLIEALIETPDRPERDAVLKIVRDWDGRASMEDTALPVVAAFRSEVIGRTQMMLLDQAKPVLPNDGGRRRKAASAIGENIVLATLENRKSRFFPTDSAWSDLTGPAAEAAIAAHLEDPETPWGERNRAKFSHPLGMAHPLVGTRFDFPAVRQPGHWGAVRVQTERAGASARMVASPSRRDAAILTVPGGQSGDPASPHYTDRHAAWAAGAPAPMLPGPPVDVIDLVPSAP